MSIVWMLNIDCSPLCVSSRHASLLAAAHCKEKEDETSRSPKPRLIADDTGEAKASEERAEVDVADRLREAEAAGYREEEEAAGLLSGGCSD